MAFFSDLWNGIKDVGSSLLDVCGIIVNKLVDGVFWLVDKVFDAIDAIADLFDWIFEKIGNIFSPSDKGGMVKILPPDPVIVGKMNEWEKKGMVETGSTVKLKQGKVALQIITNDKSDVKRAVLAGSEKGFSKDIKNAMQQGKLYNIPVEF